MTIRRKRADESEEEHLIRVAKTAVANHAARSDKTSWMRKYKNLTAYVNDNIVPLEKEIQEIQARLAPNYDKIREMRTVMVETCIHPYEDLRYNPDTKIVSCSFCGQGFNPSITSE